MMTISTQEWEHSFKDNLIPREVLENDFPLLSEPISWNLVALYQSDYLRPAFSPEWHWVPMLFLPSSAIKGTIHFPYKMGFG